VAESAAGRLRAGRPSWYERAMPSLACSAEPETLRARRAALARALDGRTAFFFAGAERPRNYPANTYPFRAGSHFLYFGGVGLAGAVLEVGPSASVLHRVPSTPEDALWHGPAPDDEALQAATGVDEIRDVAGLADAVAAARAPCTLPAVDLATRLRQARIFGLDWPEDRPVTVDDLDEGDRTLAQAVVEIRLRNDDDAVARIRAACRVTHAAHGAGVAAMAPGRREAAVRAAIESMMLAHGAEPAYGSIVSIAGEILHNTTYHRTLAHGDLLLVDAGAELDGWASDVTRTYPVGGRFLPEQRALYEVVLEAQRTAIEAVAPGVRFRDLHLAAARVLARGLVDEGILVGEVDGLLEAGAHALFFPHGLGHLLGMDVHDMEDLGDAAGYAPGRARSDAFGLCYLRLDRDLEPGMVVTIEPGLYLVPAILEAEHLGRAFVERKMVDLDRLEAFASVRGIRIEDDVLVTEEGADVLTASIPKAPEAVEEAVARRGFAPAG